MILIFVSVYESIQRPAQNQMDFSEFLARAGVTQAQPATGLGGALQGLLGTTPQAGPRKSEVQSVVVKGMEIHGRLADETLPEEKREFVTRGEIKDFVKDLVAQGVVVRYEKEDEDTLWFSILGTWLPMIVLFVFFFLFIRQLQTGGGKAMSFGKSKARLLNKSQNKVTFKDVAGIDEAKEELQEVVEFLKSPGRFTRLGGRIPKGVLLIGPPGTGKTLLAKAVAGEADVPFFSISGSEFVEMFVGVGASRVRDLFEQAKKNAPCLIFVDEIDAVGRLRGAGLGGGHDEREQTLNQLLVEMDGFESNKGVILIAATNRPDVLDPALLRPGRFDRRVVIPQPDLRGREEILKVHTRKVTLDGGLDLGLLARGTPGFSGADLENLVNEAALIAARRDQASVTQMDFEEAKDKVLMGVARKSMVMSDQEKRTTAVHEAGHTLVAKKLPGADPIHKVTIIPRGLALGLTMQLPEEDRHNYTKDWVENRIAILMGGRVAEEEVTGMLTTGAGKDIEAATDLARKMVCEWGMSELGPMTFGIKEEEIFLGREITKHANISEDTAVKVDREVARFIKAGHDNARQIITEHRVVLDALSTALLEYECLSGHEVEWIINGKDIHELKKDPSDASTQRTEAAPVPANPAA
jgi:cell division protease FtsH